MTITPKKEHAIKIIELLSHGLVCGLGTQEPGEMCVEAAVNCALGLPHGDNPPCVGSAVRAFKIALNDSSWSSNEARAKGMRKLAVAQLGSDSLDQHKFSQLLSLRATQKLLPDALRDYAKYCKPEYVEKLKSIADQCEAAKTNSEANASLASLASLAKFLSAVAEVGLGVLIEMKSPGCEWLDLCE